MPERESAFPPHDPDARLGDLFENLPAPAAQAPTADNSAPAPGSRRAAREAAASSRPEAGAPAETGADQPDPMKPEIASPIGGSPIVADGPADDEGTATRVVPVVEPARHGGRLEDLFHPHDDDAADHAPGERRSRRKGCLVALIVVLALLGAVAAGAVWAMNTYGDKISEIMGWGPPDDWEPGLATGEVFVTIDEGDTGGPVSAALFEAGVTRTKDVFYDYLVAEDPAAMFYPGVYRLQKKMTAQAALAALNDEGNKLENSVSVGEGRTLKTILPGIAETMGMPLEDLQDAVADPSAYGVAADSLEGWLFPAVYTFDPGVSAADVIGRMVERTRESLAEVGVPDADAQRILTIASIIQREGLAADFPKVSRVIQNRLQEGNQETHGLLQMDSTAQYGYGLTHEGPVSDWEWKSVVGDQNAWNTYAHAGLPAGPIATASHAAIDAAMHPAEGPWFYFVAVNLDTGETVFSATYEEQQRAEAQYRKWCEENPDGGCY